VNCLNFFFHRYEDEHRRFQNSGKNIPCSFHNCILEIDTSEFPDASTSQNNFQNFRSTSRNASFPATTSSSGRVRPRQI
jgi:hypothetical protein